MPGMKHSGFLTLLVSLPFATAVLISTRAEASPVRPWMVTTLVDENDRRLGRGTGDSLREVIRAAEASPGPDVIRFARALNGGKIVLRGKPLKVNSDVTIDGSGLPDGIEISGNFSSRVLEIGYDQMVSLKRLTVSGGELDEGAGAGILNAGALVLNQVTIADNHSHDVGWKGLAGGVANFGFLRVVRSTVSGNSTFFGAGGGIYNSGTLEVENSTFSGNSVDDGDGGAIFNDGGKVTLRHVTLSGNGVFFGGGGGISSPTGKLWVENCVVAGNTGYDGHPDEIWEGSGSGTTHYAGGNLMAGDPMLAPLGSYGGKTNTLRPLRGSPVIDAGVLLATTPRTDQRGKKRVAGAAPDLGAFESSPKAAAADATLVSFDH
jgi:hypothetical protein